MPILSFFVTFRFVFRLLREKPILSLFVLFFVINRFCDYIWWGYQECEGDEQFG